MGGNIEIFNEHEISGELVADIRVLYTESLNGCEICNNDIPKLIDELPVIAVLASQAHGITKVKDAGDLRNKETDRISCLVRELQKIGVNIAVNLRDASVSVNNNTLDLNVDDTFTLIAVPSPCAVISPSALTVTTDVSLLV